MTGLVPSTAESPSSIEWTTGDVSTPTASQHPIDGRWAGRFTAGLTRLRRAASAGAMAAGLTLVSLTQVIAGPPTPADDIDYVGSGFQLPRGAVLPASFGGPMQPGAAPIATTMPSAPMPSTAAMRTPMGMPASMMGGPAVPPSMMAAPYGIGHVGYHGMAACDAPMMAYGGCCDAGSCDGSCGCGTGGCQFEGLIPMVTGNCGCSSCLTGAVGGCLGDGGVLGSIRSGECGQSDFGILAGNIGGCLAGLAQALRPFSEGGRCAQRWYDVSVEAMLLGRNSSAISDSLVLSNDGVGNDPGGGAPFTADNPVLSVGDAEANGLELGARVSVAMILGVGGNIEATYMGGHQWSDTASAASGAGNLTSIFSGYGQTPTGGFNDAGDLQTFTSEAEFHSVEINYRRRMVGPYCRFQGSWLFGIRHLAFDNGVGFSAFGNTLANNGFNATYDVTNRFLGAQVGYDFWYNAAPGISLGTGLKGAWGQNDIDRLFVFSTDPAAIPPVNRQIDDGGRDGTVLLDLNATLVYRFSYSMAFRTSYHLIAMDDVVHPTFDQTSVQDFLGNVNQPPRFNESSLVLQGMTFGVEYLW